MAQSRVLDVGASFGGFVTEAQTAGFKVTASDINPDCVDYIKTQGVEAYAASSLMQLPKLCFDAITMLDVAGYFDDQRAELSRAREMLRDGGWLVIRTTNKLWMVRLAVMLSRFTRRRGRKLFNRAVVDTVYVQDPKTLCRLLRDCGFKRIEIEPDTTYHAQNIKLDAKAAYATGSLLSRIFRRPVFVPGVFVWAQCSSNGR
jgi:2-polyprenyl-3-methyl-5-hydroxy-6-metoxy-1,4-benzoquinol methylase